MDILSVVCIIVSAVFLLDGINLLTGISKMLAKFSMKTRAYSNSRIRDAMTRNYGKTTKLMGIYGAVYGIPLILISINIKTLSLNTTVLFILLGVSILNQGNMKIQNLSS